MRSRIVTKSVFLLIALVAGATVMASDLAPDVLVRNTAEEVLAIIRADPEIRSGKNVDRVVALAETKVLPHFDFSRMTQLAVGRNWRNATEEQRARLVPEFRTLLVRTYSSALVEYKDQTLEFPALALKPEDTQALVKTVIKQPAGSPIEMDYRMYKTPDGWKVFDVLVAGVSMVVNYRSSFESIVQRAGIEGLIDELKKKNQAGAAA